jgi:hypothetical protein
MEGTHMAVRTDIAGIKHPRQADAHSAQPSQQTSKGRKATPFHDELPLLRREQLMARATPGPAARPPRPKRVRAGVPVQGRKKPPSQMHIRRDGG